MNSEIYRRLFESLILTDEDRKQLKEKRGFTDATIDECRFKSARPDNEAAVIELLNAYTQEQLQSAGLGEVKSGGFEANKQIFEPSILIPFFDWRPQQRDTIIYFRAHKYGLPNITPLLYVPPAFDARQGLVVLAESEFKAVAAAQMGIPAIGLCGISMYAGDHFEDLAEFIKKMDMKRGIVLFDNDDKTNPKSSKYKDDPKKRYDVEYYSYIMAHKVETLVAECKIAVLPDDWRIDGGCDIDGAMADGHTADEFRAVLMAGVNKDEYKAHWPKECQSVCKPKLLKHFFRSPVGVEFGHYYKRTLKGNTVVLNNFTMQVAYNHQVGENEVVKGISLLNEEGNVTRTLEIDGEMFSSVGLFKQAIINTGEFFWKGNQADLDEVYQRLTTFGTNKITHTPFRVGRTNDVYLFHNCVIANDKVYRPEKSGAPIQVGEVGYRPKQLYTKGKTEAGMSINLYQDEFNWKEAMVKLTTNWRSNETVLGVGWIIASVFADAIYDEFRAFPLLFVSGMMHGGKTTYCEFLAEFHGIGDHVNNADETTKVALSHMLRYFSNMVVWVDEYKPSQKLLTWESYLRSIYNRQGAAKGLKDSEDQIRKVPVHGTLMLSGEAMPVDSAVNTRLISVSLDKKHVVGTNYQWLCANRYKFSRAYLDIAIQREAKLKELIASIKDMRNMIAKTWSLSDRHALNYSIIVSALEMFCPEVIPGPEFVNWCMHHAQARQVVAEEDHVMSQFIYDISSLKMNGKLSKDCYDIVTTNNGVIEKTVFLHLKGCFDAWSEYKKNIGQPIGMTFNYRTLASYATTCGWKTAFHRLEKRNARCLAIPLEQLKDEEARNNFVSGEFDEATWMKWMDEKSKIQESAK